MRGSIKANPVYEVRGNFRSLSLDATNSTGSSIYAGGQDRTATPLEDLALALVKRDAVGDVVRAMAENQPLQAEVFRRHLGLGGGAEESLRGIADSMGLSQSVVQLLNKEGKATFKLHLQLHPHLAYLRAA